MQILWMLLIGGIIGAFAGYLTSRNVPMGWIGNVIAGIIGSWIGENFLGSFGPEIAGMSLLPSIIGAVIFVVVTSLIFSTMNKN